MKVYQAMADNYVTQRKKNTEEETLQGKFENIQKKDNKTGLPNNLKTGIENLSGYGMDDVKVHYNSSKLAQLQAHAYAQGTDIHLAAGQEKHLPHEAWHVVQQKQARVKPTLQMKGNINLNDDKGLEHEADLMGAKALQFTDNRPKATTQTKLKDTVESNTSTKQLMAKEATTTIQQSETIQLTKSTRSTRPSFSGPARKQRQVTDSSDDLAHRISYNDIKTIISGTDKKKKKDLIRKITIPQRDFGRYKKGDESYFNFVESKTDEDELIKALNNSPFNLRPGIASVNRSIGASFDPNVDDAGYETDQSESLKSFALSHDSKNRTSSYMPDKDWVRVKSWG